MIVNTIKFLLNCKKYPCPETLGKEKSRDLSMQLAMETLKIGFFSIEIAVKTPNPHRLY